MKNTIFLMMRNKQLYVCLQNATKSISYKFKKALIDSLDGLTFRNQLLSILLGMPTGQNLQAKFSLPKKC